MMTIQISVLIWTVICFLLLMLILHFLLFQPVLKLLDQRSGRIRKAAAKKAEYERLSAEYEVMQKEKKAALIKERQRLVKAEIKKIRSEGRLKLEAANDERLRRVDQYRMNAEAECSELLGVLSEHGEELAVSFAETLIKE